MRSHSKHPYVVACGLLLAAATSSAREPVAIESLARTPQIQSVSMSADGKNLVALLQSPINEKETALAVWNLDNLKAAPTVTPSGDRMKFIAANAMKADRVLAIARQEWTGQLSGCGEGKTVGATKTFVVKSYLTDTKLKDFSEAFADKSRRVDVSEQLQRCFEIAGTSDLVHTLPLDPDNVIVRQLNQISLQANYYLYNLRTNQTKLLFRGDSSASPGLFNPRNGELMTQTKIEPVGSDDYEQQILIRNPQSGQFEVHRELTRKVTDRHTVDIEGYDEKTGKYYVLTDLVSDHVQAWMYDPVAKKFDDEPLLTHPTFSIGGLIFGRQPSNFNQVLGFVVDGPQREQTYVDPQMKAIHDGLKKAFPGQTVAITSYNDDLSRILFTTESAQKAPAYHVMNDRKSVVTLGSQRPWVNADLIGEQRWVNFPARDGMSIPAILDLPAGWKEGDGPLPTIIHPHGGPWARDYAGWDRSGWVPFFTSRGYAVLRPQYRGSAGIGRKLWMAGDGEWGQKMQDDNDDGAAWLVKQGIADPKRLAIMGYSYGGFAAAAAVVRPNSPYQCAISGAPVTDLARLGTKWSDSRLQRILQVRTIKGMDPMRNTDKANIPVLLYVGDRDVRTPAFHARDFYDKVKGKVPAKFELIPNMPHSMPWYHEHQTSTLKLMEDFLKNDCGPDGL